MVEADKLTGLKVRYERGADVTDTHRFSLMYKLFFLILIHSNLSLRALS